MHAEAVLLIDDDEAELRELDVSLEERMGADDDERVAARDHRASPRARRAAAMRRSDERTGIPSGSSQTEKFRKCCSARISVGAMIAV